jgi:hypothetical protein
VIAFAQPDIVRLAGESAPAPVAVAKLAIGRAFVLVPPAST